MGLAPQLFPQICSRPLAQFPSGSPLVPYGSPACFESGLAILSVFERDGYGWASLHNSSLRSVHGLWRCFQVVRRSCPTAPRLASSLAWPFYRYLKGMDTDGPRSTTLPSDLFTAFGAVSKWFAARALRLPGLLRVWPGHFIGI